MTRAVMTGRSINSAVRFMADECPLLSSINSANLILSITRLPVPLANRQGPSAISVIMVAAHENRPLRTLDGCGYLRASRGGASDLGAPQLPRRRAHAHQYRERLRLVPPAGPHDSIRKHVDSEPRLEGAVNLSRYRRVDRPGRNCLPESARNLFPGRRFPPHFLRQLIQPRHHLSHADHRRRRRVLSSRRIFQPWADGDLG